MKASALMLILSLIFSGCFGGAPPSVSTPDSPPTNPMEGGSPGETPVSDLENYEHFVADALVADVVEHAAFEGFGQYLFPIKNRDSYSRDMRLNNIGSLLPYHRAIQTDTTVEVLNYMLDEVANSNNIFYDIYSDEDKRADPGLEDTGLFFFRGEPGAPFAIVCAGGGFSYVGSIHESFPHALELSKLGYNAFAIEYRTGSGQLATEDLAAAISFIFENADELGVSTESYSLWGSSAGARMAATIGSYGPAAFGGDDLPRPAAVMIGYTGHSDYSPDDTPTFTNVSQNDPIANASVVQRRVDNMRAAGIDVELELYQNAGHGFGLGIGTDAEGWLGRAVTFWEKYIDS